MAPKLAPPAGRGFVGNQVYRTDDGGTSWRRMSDTNVAGGKSPYAFNQIRVDPSNDQNLFVGGVEMYKSTDGGKTFRANAGRGVHADQHAMWINPKDGQSGWLHPRMKLSLAPAPARMAFIPRR